jgi:hypothetical protein
MLIRQYGIQKSREAYNYTSRIINLLCNNFMGHPHAAQKYLPPKMQSRMLHDSVSRNACAPSLARVRAEQKKSAHQSESCAVAIESELIFSQRSRRIL